jgi:hypothetical protein
MVYGNGEGICSGLTNNVEIYIIKSKVFEYKILQKRLRKIKMPLSLFTYKTIIREDKCHVFCKYKRYLYEMYWQEKIISK